MLIGVAIVGAKYEELSQCDTIFSILYTYTPVSTQHCSRGNSVGCASDWYSDPPVR